MTCPNCSAENPEAARFCSQCGHSLAYACPNCGTENPLGAKFCNNCGHPLAAQAPAASPIQEKLLQYIPKELLTKLESARAGQGQPAGRHLCSRTYQRGRDRPPLAAGRQRLSLVAVPPDGLH